MFHTEALRLEELLADFGMAVRVGPASVSTNSLRFPLQLGLGATIRRMLTLTPRIAETAGYSQGHLRREGRTLFLELPRAEAAGLRYGDLLDIAGQPPMGSALVGLLEGGEPLLLNVTNAHGSPLLVCGGSGTGKSELLRVIALGMAARHAPRRWRVALLSSHARSPLAPLRALPHCYAWSASTESAVGWLVRLHSELEERERGPHNQPRLLVLVDDAGCVLEAGGNVARGVLRDLLERGPAVGIHLVLACQSLEQMDDLLPLLATRLIAEGGSLAGRFLLWGEGLLPLSVTAARLDSDEARNVVERVRTERPRLVARAAERSEL